MKITLPLLFLLAAVAAEASPVDTFGLVVSSHGSARTTSGMIHPGQMLPASSELTVPAGKTYVELQMTGDATYAAADSSPAATSTAETLIQVEPGSALSLAKMEATDTGIGTMHQISLNLKRGSVLISARRLSSLSAFNLATPAGRVSISEGTVKVSAHSIAVAAGRAVFYPRSQTAKTAVPVVLDGDHSYDTRSRAVSVLSPKERSSLRRQAMELHSVGPAHLSLCDDLTEDDVSPVHPGHHHHHYHHHHRRHHERHHSFQDGSSGYVYEGTSGY